MSVVAAKQPQKTYVLVDKKPFFKHFYPKDVAILAVRSAAMQGLMVFNAYVASLDLEISDDEESSEDEFEDVDAAAEDKEEFVPPSMEEFSLASAKSFGKSLSITTYVRSLEEVALRFFRPQIVSKLIKGEGLHIIHIMYALVAVEARNFTDIVCAVCCNYCLQISASRRCASTRARRAG